MAEMLELDQIPHDEAAEQPTDESANMTADDAAGRPNAHADDAWVWTGIGFAVGPGTSRASDISEAYKQGERHGYMRGVDAGKRHGHVKGFDEGYAQGHYNGWLAGCHATIMHNLPWYKGCPKSFEQDLALGKSYKDGKSGKGGLG